MFSGMAQTMRQVLAARYRVPGLYELRAGTCTHCPPR